MATAFTTLLGYALPTTGELDGIWGDEVNDSITQLVEDSVAGYASQDMTAADWTLTTTGSGLSNEARMMVLITSGTPGVSRNIIAPSHSKMYIVANKSNANVVLKGAATTGATIGAGYTAVVVWNGSDFEEISPTLAKYAVDLIGGVQGSVPYQNAANTTTFLAPDTAGKVLTTQGAGAAPTWANASISGGVQGSIPYQSAPNTTALLNPGTSGQVLTSGGSGANPSWATPSVSLILLATVTPTAATTVQFLNTFSSTYDNYLVLIDNVAPASYTSTPVLQYQFVYSGTTVDNSSVYIDIIPSIESTTTTTQGRMFSFNTGFGSGQLNIYNANDGTNMKWANSYCMANVNSTASGIVNQYATGYTKAIAISGISFFWSNGSNFSATGRVRVYGYRNS